MRKIVLEISKKREKIIMPNILTLDKKQLLELDHGEIHGVISAEEVEHIFKTFDGLWLYDYDALFQGRPGLHAELKSGRCSDGFLNAHQVLSYPEIRKIFAHQIARKFLRTRLPKPDHVIGIPTGATKLGQDVAEILDCNFAEMIKNDQGKIKLITQMSLGAKILIVEDFCSMATGFIEAVTEIVTAQDKHNQEVFILPIEMLIINRGEVRWIPVPKIGFFETTAIANIRFRDWAYPCKLCEQGSERIKPKATKESWQRIINSQLPY
ncbi:MAG: hypothetical protein WCK16_00370 [Candidatus Moraniibacteriota bacterium]